MSNGDTPRAEGHQGPGAADPNRQAGARARGLQQVQAGHQAAVRATGAEYDVPFFFKQVGGSRKINGTWGVDLLDGKQYHEFPRA